MHTHKRTHTRMLAYSHTHTPYNGISSWPEPNINLSSQSNSNQNIFSLDRLLELSNSPRTHQRAVDIKPKSYIWISYAVYIPTYTEREKKWVSEWGVSGEKKKKHRHRRKHSGSEAEGTHKKKARKINQHTFNTETANCVVRSMPLWLKN